VTLSFDPDTPDLPLYHCIGGEWVKTDGALEMRRPSDGKRYGACPVADLVDCVVQTAKQSLRTSGWADVRPRERVVALQRWTDLIQKEALTLGRLEAVSTAQLVGTDIKVIAEQMPIARPTAWPYTRYFRRRSYRQGSAGGNGRGEPIWAHAPSYPSDQRLQTSGARMSGRKRTSPIVNPRACLLISRKGCP
jgi:hypothetical protein